MRNKSLIFTDYFLPGYKAGGALKSIFNSINIIKNDTDITLITKGYDVFKRNKYKNVRLNKMISSNGIRIIYIFNIYFPEFFLLLKILLTTNLLKNCKYKTIYLNSFFSPFSSLIPQFLVLIGFLKCNKLVISPRGEITESTMKLKPIRKKMFLYLHILLFKLINNCKLIYHSSSIFESSQISHYLNKEKIIEAIDPPSLISPDLTLYKPDDRLFKIVYFSRVDKKKNLLFLINCLKKSSFDFTLKLDIIGPICDQSYWLKCNKSLLKLPTNITFEYCGSFSPEEIYKTIPKYDLFVFPTFSENFGHVVFESIRLGTPVLLSKNTPWECSVPGIVNTLDLDSYSPWIKEIQKFSTLEMDKRKELAKYISNNVTTIPLFSKIKEQHRELFL